VETEPDEVTRLEYDKYSSKNTFIDIEWDLIDLENNGGSPIIGYEVYVQHGDDTLTH
jgi:hypothetical protein